MDQPSPRDRAPPSSSSRFSLLPLRSLAYTRDVLQLAPSSSRPLSAAAPVNDCYELDLVLVAV